MMVANDQAHGHKTTRYEKVHIFYTRMFPMGQLIKTQLNGTQLIGVIKLRVNQLGSINSSRINGFIWENFIIISCFDDI